MISNLKSYSLRITGTIILIFYLFFRFIRERSFSNLYFIYWNKDNEQITIDFVMLSLCMIFIISSAYGIYFSIKQIKKKEIYFPNNIITRFLLKIIYLIKLSLKAVEEAIGENIPDSYNKIKKIILSFYYKYGYKEKNLIFIFVCIPYILVSLTLLFEVIIYFKIAIFFKMILFLILPLVFSLWFYLIESFLENINIIEQKLKIIHVMLPDGRDDFTFRKRPEVNLTNSEFIQYKDEYLQLYPLKGFLESINFLSNHYKPRAFLFMYICYFSTWLYILITNIFIYGNY